MAELALDKLMAALTRRGALAGSAAEQLTARMERWVVELQEELPRKGPAKRGGDLPRHVATAMACAVIAQPHLAVTFRRPTDTTVAPPLLLAPEVLERILGVPQWELEDIREDIDRRVRVALKQASLLHWLWSRFGLPEAPPQALFRALVPGAARDLGAVGLMRRGSQLYLVVDQEALPESAMYLAWTGRDAASSSVETFSGRYVEASLLKAAARCLGGDVDEIADLLDRSVKVVPRASTNALISADRWRSRGWAHLTGLGGQYNDGRWLVSPVTPDRVEWERSLVVRDGKLEVQRAEESFDLTALPRVQAMYRQLATWMLAGFEVRTDPASLELVDVGFHIRSVLQPILAWTKAPEAVRHVTAELGVSADEARRGLDALRKAWEAQMLSRWVWREGETKPTVQGVILTHLLATHSSLRRFTTTKDEGHRELLRLFAAFYCGTTPVQRLWNRGLSDMPGEGEGIAPVEDVVGEFFPALWAALSDNEPGPEVEEITALDTLEDRFE